MFRLLIRVRLLGLKNVVKLALRRNAALSLAYAVGGTLLFGGIYWGFRFFLRLGAATPGGRDQMVHDLFHFLFLFVVAGAVPFVASTLLHAGDYLLLSAAPIPPTAITAAKLIDATVTNSLQFTVIGIPAIAACASELGLSVAGWPALLVLLLLFLLLPALATALLLLVALAVFGMRRLRRVIAVANLALATFVCLTMVLEVQRLPIRQALTAWPPTAAVTPGGPHVGPSGWFSTALLNIAHGDWSAGMSRIGVLSLLIGALFGICMLLGGRILSAATMAEEGEGDRPRDLLPDAGITGRFLRAVLPAPAAAIVAKDLRYTARDSVLMGQLILPIILYLVPFVLAAHPAVRSIASWTELGYVSVAMTGIVVFMQTSILSLSSVGLEGRSFWIQKAAPNTAGMLALGKLAVSMIISAGTGLILIIVSGIAFSTAPWLVAVECVIVFIACLALCGMGVGLSAMLPRFIYENPAHRVSVWALILGFVGSVAYVFVCGILFAIAYLLAGQNADNETVFYVVGAGLFIVVSLATALVPMWMGVQRLERYQWEH